MVKSGFSVRIVFYKYLYYGHLAFYLSGLVFLVRFLMGYIGDDVLMGESSVPPDERNEYAFHLLNDRNFGEQVLHADRPVLVEFSTDWCGCSQIFAFMLKDLIRVFGDRIKLCRIDYTRYEKIAKEYGVYTIPTILLFREGRVVDHIIGSISKKRMIDKLAVLVGKRDLREE